jgi:hypothetical protein
MANGRGASITERQYLKSSQDRKVGPRATWQAKKGRWVPYVKNSFSLPPIDSCPGRTDLCASACYAVNFNNFAGVDQSFARNFYLLLEAERTEGEEGMYLLLSDLIQRIRRSFIRSDVNPRDWVYRIHPSGDFFSLLYARAWRRVMEENPDIFFWAYTRSFQPECNVVPLLLGITNFQIYISGDAENIVSAKQICSRYDLPLAPLGIDATHGWELHEGRERRAIVCPENTGRLKLMKPDKQNPQNGRGACLDCRVCFKGRYDVIFIDDKRRADQPVLFRQKAEIAPPPAPSRQCRYRYCTKEISGSGNKAFCDATCRLAEYRLRQGQRSRPKAGDSVSSSPRSARPKPRVRTQKFGSRSKVRFGPAEMIEHLRAQARQFGRLPVESDLEEASLRACIILFGSLENAIHMAGRDQMLKSLKEEID